ncbi:hypothetical protein HPP92_009954 [Vanilla planifolia]|uniref:Aminoacyl-tRNA synthetase class II (D/K/N) domain-containing protein n=1 Tax=Vanilla planifolia TaxID=51239 RepID=A0A835V302_VANPL|nr:hypothetical protein HPP92_009954 [Vanilla planifolia]
MASEVENPSPATENRIDGGNTASADGNPTIEIASDSSESKVISKKQAKKEAAKAEKIRRKQEEASSAGAASAKLAEADPLACNYGDVPIEDLQSKAVTGRKWTEVGMLDAKLANGTVLIRGVAQTIRAVGKKMAFLVVRQFTATVQCVLTVSEELESIVDVEGVVSIPTEPIKGTTQQVEIQVTKLHCINRAVSNLPINIEDAARSEEEIKEAEKAGEKLVRVNQDTRLNNRVLDLRTPANQAIFVCSVLWKMFSEIFCDLRTLLESILPTLQADGYMCWFWSYLKLDLSSEQRIHTLTGICVLDIVDRLFVTMFDYLNEKCKKLLDAINRQYPFKPLKYLRKTLCLTFEEGIQMLKDAGIEVDPFGDLNTEAERTLGRLVLDKYNTEFYILHRYPLAVRPFYTMPCPDNPLYSNSFDVFIRGEEIISGAQRVHFPDLLTSQAKARGIDVSTISAYVNSFRYAPLLSSFLHTAPSRRRCNVMRPPSQVRRVSSWWLRDWTRTSGDALLRPWQHPSDISVPARPAEADSVIGNSLASVAFNKAASMLNFLVLFVLHDFQSGSWLLMIFFVLINVGC